MCILAVEIVVLHLQLSLPTIAAFSLAMTYSNCMINASLFEVALQCFVAYIARIEGKQTQAVYSAFFS
jgi:hypothetical protein